MGFTHLDSNVIQAFEEAKIDAEQHGQTFVNSVRLFKAAIKIVGLPANNLIDLSDGIKSILHKYSVNLKDIGVAANELWPAIDGSSAGFEPVEDPDIINIRNSLISEAESTKQTQNMYNLFSALFRDENYALFKCLQKVSDNHQKEFEETSKIEQDKTKLPACGFDVHSLYADIKRFLSSKVSWDIAALETEAMQKFIENLNTKFSKEELHTKFVGMEREMMALQMALAGRTVKSAMLVGEAGTGKSELVYELVRRIIKGEVPDFLKSVVVYELHLSAVQAGASFVGQFEDRLCGILNAVKKLNNVIVFIDEIHSMTNKNGSFSASDIIKPYLSRGDLWLIGATTTGEFSEFIGEDKAIARRFSKILIREPSLEETHEILDGVSDVNSKYFGKTIPQAITDKILKYSQEYNMELANPAKSITMLENACAYSKVFNPNSKEVTDEDIIKSVELRNNIIINQNRTENTEKSLKSQLFGQDEAIDKIIERLKMIDENIVEEGRPKAVMLFTGSTGVGKTAAAKITAKEYFGTENAMIMLSGSDLQDSTSVNRILGSSQGYVGYKPVSDFLQKIQQNPNCVLLVDEIEKAHDTVFKAFLNMMNDGFMTAANGDKISFKNVVVIFTTNLGYGTSAKSGAGLLAMKAGAKTAENAIKEYFSPEFLDRLDCIINFNRLDNKVIEKIIEKYRKIYSTRSGKEIKFTKEDIEDIKKRSDIETFGAREVSHIVALKCHEVLNRKAGK